MKSVIRRFLTLTASVFLVLLLSSAVFAFPSIHLGKTSQQTWTYWGGSSSGAYLDAGQGSYPFERAAPMMDYQPNGDPSPAAVPEPATVALMAVGLFGLGLLQRHRRNKTA